MKITAILASHNRCERTLQCLSSYFGQETAPTVELAAVLVDDGSRDGTVHAVRERFPGVEVIEGDGNLFWAGAMTLAEQAALSHNPEYLLWLNDDVILDREAVSTLIDTSSRETESCITVGAMRDPATGELTYSGVRRRGRHPLRVDLVPPGDEPVEVETFNGNVVLVPRSVATRVGPIDGSLVHAGADFDYGLRAAEAGVVNLLAAGTVGTCVRVANPEPWLDPAIPAKRRLRLFVGPKGMPPRARAHYLMRHGGRLWLLFWLAPYIRTAPAILWSLAGRQRAPLAPSSRRSSSDRRSPGGSMSSRTLRD